MARQLSLMGEPEPPEAPRMVKALTLHQPWASAWVWGVKAHETRSWQTAYRGWLAIHAGGALPAYARAAMRDNRAIQAWLRHIGDPGDGRSLPFGQVLAIGFLGDVAPTERVRGDLSGMQEAFGNYRAGRFAWSLSRIAALDPPRPAKGARGLWSWALPADVTLSEGRA